MPGAGPRRRATYDDVLAAPEHVVAAVIFGVLHTSPRTAIAQARVSSRLGSELDGPLVLRLHGARYEIFATHKDDESVRAEPLDAVPLELGALWADLARE